MASQPREQPTHCRLRSDAPLFPHPPRYLTTQNGLDI